MPPAIWGCQHRPVPSWSSRQTRPSMQTMWVGTTNTWSCIELVFSGAEEPPGRDRYPPGYSPRRVANAQCSPHIERSGKKGRLMIKRYIRWILPLVVIVLIGVYFLVSPMVATHAAGSAAPAAPSQITAPHGITPDYFWHH